MTGVLNTKIFRLLFHPFDQLPPMKVCEEDTFEKMIQEWKSHRKFKIYKGGKWSYLVFALESTNKLESK